MPVAMVNGVSIHYLQAGEGSETIVFSHGYLMSHRMYDHQIATLKDRYNIIAFDHRCHGASEQVRTEFGMYDLVEDAAALIQTLSNEPVHFIGMSTGGFVGMRLALRYPELIKSLTLIDTSADIEDPKKKLSNSVMLEILRWFGVKPLIGKAMSALMGRTFLKDGQRKVLKKYWQDYILSLNKLAIRQFGLAIFSRDSVVDALSQLTGPPPTLVVVGSEDIATPVAKSQQLHTAIKDSRLVIVPNAGHTSPVEEPEVVTQAIDAFLTRQKDS
ncbi:MAG: alpha/beta fold hydrolase [Alteromonadaceae bacterium]|nr:alpha/beta fold hydrolase [Alteromonadaceae bacterium]